MRIIWVPLEPLPERYTEDWARWFPREFERLGVEYLTIDGEPLTTRIETGDVLDAFGTNYWKASQLQEIMLLWYNGNFREDDVFLFADLWFPGIEMLAYARAFAPGPKIAGILHAGTYDPNDFTVRRGMRSWGMHFEYMLGELVDAAFVATEYHKKILRPAFNSNSWRKIHVTGLPFYAKELREEYDNGLGRSARLVAFPHRLDPEKQPDVWRTFQAGMPPTTSFITTAEPRTSKDDYYRTLSYAKVAVSFALQETFGYAMLEASALGAIPIVPDALSYREMYPLEYRYVSGELNHAIGKASRAIAGDLPPLPLSHFDQYEHSIERMVEQCRNL